MLGHRKIRGFTFWQFLVFLKAFGHFWGASGGAWSALEAVWDGPLHVWDGSWDALGGLWTSLGAPREGPRKSLGVILARLGMLQARLGVTKSTPGRAGSDLGFIRVHFFLSPCMLRGLGVGCARTKL